MDIANLRSSDEIITSIDLSLMDISEIEQHKTQNNYECPDCKIDLTPASYLPINQKSPYFMIARKSINHLDDCIHNSNQRTLRKYQKTYYNSEEEVQFRFPNSLKTIPNQNINIAIETKPEKTTSEKSRSISKTYQATTLYAVAKTFILFPLARGAMSLKISGIKGRTYDQCFKKIKFNQQQSDHVFYGLSKWHSLRTEQDYISLTLLSWNIELKQPAEITLMIDCSNWTDRVKKSFQLEFNTANENAIRSFENKSRDKTWIFFIGTQYSENLNIFHLENRKHISILHGNV